jgi:ubiquitin carboxyl-terminal hydrolase L5
MDVEGTTKRRKLLDVDEAPSDLFFARQVIHNACATQAILSILFNSPSESAASSHGFQLGSTLEELKSFMMSLPPDMRGETIGSSDTVRTVHNSFAQRNMFGIDSKKKQVTSSSEDVYHFIAYGMIRSSLDCFLD